MGGDCPELPQYPAQAIGALTPKPFARRENRAGRATAPAFLAPFCYLLGGKTLLSRGAAPECAGTGRAERAPARRQQGGAREAEVGMAGGRRERREPKRRGRSGLGKGQAGSGRAAQGAQARRAEGCLPPTKMVEGTGARLAGGRQERVGAAEQRPFGQPRVGTAGSAESVANGGLGSKNTAIGLDGCYRRGFLRPGGCGDALFEGAQAGGNGGLRGWKAGVKAMRKP